jgi:hypothetical protein
LYFSKNTPSHFEKFFNELIGELGVKGKPLTRLFVLQKDSLLFINNLVQGLDLWPLIDVFD